MHAQVLRNVAGGSPGFGEPLGVPDEADMGRQTRADEELGAVEVGLKAPSTSPVFRVPHASDSPQEGASRACTASASTSRAVTGSLPAQVAIFSTSLSSFAEVVADERDERLARLTVGLDAEARELLGHPAGDATLGHVPGEDVARLRDGFRER